MICDFMLLLWTVAGGWWWEVGGLVGWKM
jgi:hypothetical protein